MAWYRAGGSKPKQNKTVTPKATSQTVKPDAGKELAQVTVNGDADLVAANIRTGKNIFGIDGSYNGEPVINAIIENYKAATDNISAATFVKYVEEYGLSLVGGTTQIYSEYVSYPHTFKLDDSRVLVVYSQGSSGSLYLYGVVCTISGTTVTVGSRLRIGTSHVNYGAIWVSGGVLTDGRVLIVYPAAASKYLAASVLSISNTTITTSIAETMLDNSMYYIGDFNHIVMLDNNKAFLTHRNPYGSSNYYGLDAHILTVTSTAITIGTATNLVGKNVNNNYGVKEVSITKLSNNKIFVFYYDDDAAHRGLYAKVCTISGDTITSGSDYLLLSFSDNTIAAVALSESKVFVKYCDYYSKVMYGTVCNITGNVVTFGEPLALYRTQESIGNASQGMSLIKLSNNAVMMLFGLGSASYKLGVLTASVMGDAITVNSFLQLSNNSNYGAMNNGANRLVHVAGNRYFAVGAGTSITPVSILFDAVKGTTGLVPSNNTYEMQGLTKDICTPSVAGGVYVLA